MEQMLLSFSAGHFLPYELARQSMDGLVTYVGPTFETKIFKILLLKFFISVSSFPLVLSSVLIRISDTLNPGV